MAKKKKKTENVDHIVYVDTFNHMSMVKPSAVLTKIDRGSKRKWPSITIELNPERDEIKEFMDEFSAGVPYVTTVLALQSSCVRIVAQLHDQQRVA